MDALAQTVDTEASKTRSFFGRVQQKRMSSIRPQHTPNVLQRSSSASKGIRISAPYDFQHVAKIEETHPQPMRVESPEVFERIRSLSRGHRHAIIAPPLDDEEVDTPNEVSVHPRKAPPVRPQRPDDLWGETPHSAPLPLREEPYLSAAYIDNSRQPSMLRSRGRSFNRPLPTRSATDLSQSFLNGPGPAFNSATGNVDPFDDYDAFIPLYDSQPPGWIENSLPLLHTVSPVEAYADHIRTPAFQPPLEQVPEEPEGSFSNRPSKDLPRRPSLRHSKSTPVIATRFRASVIDPAMMDEFPLPSSATRPDRPLSQCSQGSDTLGNPLNHSWLESKPKAKARSLQEEKTVTEPSWEDYIEYCYENNAEADCEFDWQGNSHFNDEDSEASESWMSEQYSPYGKSSKLNQDAAPSFVSSMSKPSFQSDNLDRVPSHTSVPELDYRISRATSNASGSIATPRESEVPPMPKELHPSKDAWAANQGEVDDADFDDLRSSIYMIHKPPKMSLARVGPAERFFGEALPTPPLSSKKSASLLERSLKSKASSISSITIDELAAETALPPDTPSLLQDAPEPKKLAKAHKILGIVGGARPGKAWPLNDEMMPPMPAPTSAPYGLGMSHPESFMASAKPLSPPQSPPLDEGERTRSFLATPSPRLMAKPKPSPIIEEMSHPDSPIHVSFPSIDLQPLSLPRASSQERTVCHAHTSSVADRIGPLPQAPLRQGTPDSATSAPENLGRTGYSLFPSKKASMTSLNSPPLPLPPTSAPVSMSEPSLVRPVSRAESQASSQRSSSSRGFSTKSKSSKKSKANAYQERFPLGI